MTNDMSKKDLKSEKSRESSPFDVSFANKKYSHVTSRYMEYATGTRSKSTTPRQKCKDDCMGSMESMWSMLLTNLVQNFTTIKNSLLINTY